MKQVLKCNIKAGAKRTNGPRLWKHNTDLCVDIKTLLCRDRVAKVGKNYYGVLKHDRIGHYTFKEHSLPAPKRNPRVFDGRHITVTQRDDGSLRPNFKPLAIGPGFDIAAYASEVANELLWALTSLIEK